MAEVLVFHHAHGLTDGVRSFADRVRSPGHVVHVPDLYEGRTFDDLAAGVAYAEQVGFGAIAERGVDAATGLPSGLVYVGFSLGVLPAQRLAQTRPGASGAVLVSACVPLGTFGDGWPAGVPVQIHAMDGDELFVGDGDLDAAHGLADAADDAELFLEPGDRHLFADPSLPSYHEVAAEALVERVLALLARLDSPAAGQRR